MKENCSIIISTSTVHKFAIFWRIFLHRRYFRDYENYDELNSGNHLDYGATSKNFVSKQRNYWSRYEYNSDQHFDEYRSPEKYSTDELSPISEHSFHKRFDYCSDDEKAIYDEEEDTPYIKSETNNNDDVIYKRYKHNDKFGEYINFRKNDYFRPNNNYQARFKNNMDHNNFVRGSGFCQRGRYWSNKRNRWKPRHHLDDVWNPNYEDDEEVDQNQWVKFIFYGVLGEVISHCCDISLHAIYYKLLQPIHGNAP